MKKILILIAVSLSMLACQQQNGYKITGTIEGATEGNVILQKIAEGMPLALDTVPLTDGKFIFEGEAAHPELFLIQLEGVRAYIAFFAENSNISITAQKDSLQGAVITGSEVNKTLDKFNDEMPMMERSRALNAEAQAAQAAGDKEKLMALQQEYMGIMNQQKEYLESFVDANTDNPVGAYFALTMARQMDLEQLRELIAKFETGLVDHPYVAELKKVLEPLEAFEKAQDLTAVGQEAPEFTLKTDKGEEVKLSSFKGKYVLLDFWASWCKPCRAENPNVVKAYNKFKNKGFEVVSVSIDQDKEAWLKAVTDDGLVWTQMFDEGGAIATTYGVQSIPHTLLLDKEGKIIEKQLRGEALTAKLAELLN